MRFKAFVLLVIFIIPLMAGCWDVQEINRRGVADAVFFDVGNPKKIKMGVSLNIPGTQIPPVSGTTQQFEKRHFVIEGEGDSAVEAWNQIQSNVVRTVSFRQIRAIILSEEYAQGNINDLLEFIGRIPLVPPNTNVLIAKTDPKKLLDIKNNPNYIPGIYIEYYLELPYKKTLALPLNLWEVNSYLDKKWQDPTMPLIEVAQQNYKIAGAGVFSKSRLVGQLDVDEAQTLAMLKGMKTGTLTLHMDQNKIASFADVNSKIKITPNVSKNGTLSFNVDVNVKGGLVESLPHREITKDEIDRIEKAAERFTKERIERLLDKLQAWNSDPVGFGGKFRIQYPHQWKKIDWHQVYPTAVFNVDCKFTVKEIGLFR